MRHEILPLFTPVRKASVIARAFSSDKIPCSVAMADKGRSCRPQNGSRMERLPREKKSHVPSARRFYEQTIVHAAAVSQPESLRVERQTGRNHEVDAAKIKRLGLAGRFQQSRVASPSFFSFGRNKAK